MATKKKVEEAVVEEVKDTEVMLGVVEEKKAVNCPVCNYVADLGILSFILDGVFCQTVIEPNLAIGKTVSVVCTGKLGKDATFEVIL